MRHKRISKGLRLAIKAATKLYVDCPKNGKRALARGLGIREQAINNWKRVPRNRIMAVERLTGVPKEILAPDIFRRVER
jgi:DNA-binding transcriptional regulator YdaS (Cro superfamily)